jgi:hypothetical protein
MGLNESIFPSSPNYDRYYGYVLFLEPWGMDIFHVIDNLRLPQRTQTLDSYTGASPHVATPC